MKFVTTGLMMTFLLTGCDPATSDALIMPDVVKYSVKTQSAAADEIEAGFCPVMTEMVKDYSVMRDQSRAAKKKLNKR